MIASFDAAIERRQGASVNERVAKQPPASCCAARAMSAPQSRAQLLAPDAITLRIATVRGIRVILDTDLAALYEVETKRFNEAVKRNVAKFPADFMSQLTTEEWADLRSQFATLNATECLFRAYRLPSGVR